MLNQLSLSGISLCSTFTLPPLSLWILPTGGEWVTVPCICFRPCVSSSRGSHGNWATLCFSAHARIRRAPNAGAAPSYLPARTRRGTSPAAWSSGIPAGPTLSAGETSRSLVQTIRCDCDMILLKAFFCYSAKTWLFPLMANQGNQLKCSSTKKSTIWHLIDNDQL